MLAPKCKVVNLLDLDAAEPRALLPVLLAPFLNRARPDLGRHGHLTAPLANDLAHRRLRAAVHRRAVDEATTRVESRSDHLPRQAGVGLERPPGSEPDGRAEPALLHYRTNS